MAEFEAAAAAATGGILQRECQTSEEDQIRSSDLEGGGGGRSQTQIIQSSSGSDGGPAEGGSATVEVARKSKGRPPGSKNKPKPPITITRDNENAMKPHILEVAPGCDIGASVLDFVQRRQVGLCVMSGSGTAASAILRRFIVPASQLLHQYRGQLEILSLSGMYLPAPSSSSWTGGLTVSLAGPQGQLVGGSVMGEFIAAGLVTIIATSFTNPSYHRLRAEVDEENAVNTQLQADNQGSMAASAGHVNPPPAIYNNEGAMAASTGDVNPPPAIYNNEGAMAASTGDVNPPPAIYNNQGATAASTGHVNPPPAIDSNTNNSQLLADLPASATGARPPN